MGTIPQHIKTLSNKRLLATLNKIRKEKEHPEIYGKHGTTQYVTDTQFWRGHIKILRKELTIRKKKGLIKKSAGKKRKTQYGYSFW